MSLLLSFCLKLSVSLALVSLFYQLVLRRLTFYNWNRYYLLGYSLLSFIVAFIDISPVLHQNKWSETALVQWVPVLNSSEVITTSQQGSTLFNPSTVLGLFLIIGVAVMCLRLLFQLFSFQQLKKKAEFISIEGMKFYQVNDSIIPFSFGNSIFLNRYLHSEQELKEIVRHEFVHVKQMHSIDIIWGEVLCLVNWYNPFAWLLKASMRQNLEFIADNKVLENGINKREYQYLLLKVIGNKQFSIAQKFNFSSLKKRIAMMNKLKSARLNLVRFLFILPLIAALLLAFRNGGAGNPGFKMNALVPSPTGVVTPRNELTSDTVPSKKSTKPAKVSDEKDLSTLSDDFEITENRAVIHLKNGTTETYDLKNNEQRKIFEEKYGKINGKIINVTNSLFELKRSLIECPTNATPSVATVAVDGVTTAISPVNVVNSVNATVATTVSTSVTAVTPPNNSTTIIASPQIESIREVQVVNDVHITNGKEEILLTITRNTSPQQLEDYRKQMKQQSVDLKYNDIKYDDNGVLVRLSGSMESKDVNSRFSGSDFEKIIVSMVRDGDRSYLKVNIVAKKTTKPRKEVI